MKAKRLKMLSLLRKQRIAETMEDKKRIMNEIDDLENDIELDEENESNYGDDDYTENGGYSDGYISDVNKYLG